VQAFIEKTYTANGNKPVIAVSFSLGGPVMALFLQQYVPEAWKTKYVSSVLSFSGVFGGTAETLTQQLQV